MADTARHRGGGGDGGPVRGGGGGPGTGGTQRLEALSDGVFAIAMTLLVLDVSVPPGLGDAAFHRALGEAMPNIAAYALSFAVIAQFWRDHRRILDAAPRGDGAVTGLTLLGLALVALLPFPTSLLAEYTDQALAVAIYAGTVATTNAVHTALALAVRRGELLRRPAGTVTREVGAERRRLAVDAGVTAVVFGVTTPLAFVSPSGAMWLWLTLVPLNIAIGRRQRRARQEAASG